MVPGCPFPRPRGVQSPHVGQKACRHHFRVTSEAPTAPVSVPPEEQTQSTACLNFYGRGWVTIGGVGTGQGTCRGRGLAHTPGVDLGSADPRTPRALNGAHLAEPEPLWEFLDIETCGRGECACLPVSLGGPLTGGGETPPALSGHGLQVASCSLHREEAYASPRTYEVFICMCSSN